MWERCTYRGLDDDVPDGGVVEGLEGCSSLGVSNSSQNETLIEVDSIVCNVTEIVSHIFGVPLNGILTRETMKRPLQRGPWHASTG
jgi:hypothetical protein